MADTEPKPEAVEEEELADYESEEEIVEDVKEEEGKTKGGSYVGVHSSGFRDFLLKNELLRAIQECGFEHPSEVQQECVPEAILGVDVVCQAKSGMGKTAVFVLSILHQLEPKDGEISVVVVAHARELAFQIAREFERFSKFLPAVKTMVSYGGIPIGPQKERIKTNTPHIIVTTPGRMTHLIKDNAIDLSKVKHFVVDECDEVLEGDMRQDVQMIFKATPKNKQVMMFSATMNNDLRKLCKRFMHDPREVSVDDDKLTLHGLLQHYVTLEENQKIAKLAAILDVLQFNQVVIFVSSVQRAESLCKRLCNSNLPAIAMHSGHKQTDRIRLYKEFKEFQHRIAVATDLIHRGIDVERVNIVINFDMPTKADTYLHRVGRAGRFGTKGLSVSFVSSEDNMAVMKDIQDRFEVKVTELPDEIDTSLYM